MKLLTKTGLNFISASVFFFLIGSLGGYYFIRFAVNRSLNNELLWVRDHVFHNDSMDINKASISYLDIQLDSTSLWTYSEDYLLTDTILTGQHNDKPEFFRCLKFPIKQKNQWYTVHLMRSTTASDLLIMKFTLMLTIFPIAFFLILYLVNRQTTKYSLAVFYDTIRKLKTFDVHKDNSLELLTSDVDEFEQLKEVFSAMDQKIKDDYERLKQYVENTSHELQTPLAIITSRLDELLQSPNLSEEQIKLVAGLLDTTGRLSKVNQSLIFLAKLDNRLFKEVKNIDLVDLIKLQLTMFESLYEEKNLKVDFDLDSDTLVFKMDASLGHTLIQNLLKNAFRHNVTNGYIKITTTNNELRIENSGEASQFTNDEIFDRFRKGASSKYSLGIGLSIVKRICEISNISIHYKAFDEKHVFTLKQQ